MLGATYFDDEYITQKLLTILGDADQYDEMMKRKDAESMERLDIVDPEVDNNGNDGPSAPNDREAAETA